MNEMELKYGCNPNQKPARVFMHNDKDLPFQVLSGRPGYINLRDSRQQPPLSMYPRPAQQ